MDDELEIFSGLDQTIQVNALPTLNWVDTVFQQSVEEQDVNIAFRAANEMLTAFRVQGIGLSKLLYLMKTNWQEYKLDDSFEYTAFSVIGLSRTTIDRYITVWSMYANRTVPPDLQNRIMSQPMKNQIPIAKTLASGYTIDEESWELLAEAPDNSTILSIIRKVKNVPPRKGALGIHITPNGDLYAWVEGVHKTIGWLNLREAESDEVIKKAVTRIINNTGILRD